MKFLNKICLLNPERSTADVSGDEIYRAVAESTLLGRGWSGFQVSKKWQLLKKAEGKKEIVCLISGDCAAALMEANPEAVYTGTALAAMAFGEETAWIVSDRALSWVPDKHMGVDFHFRRIEHTLSSGEETRIFAVIEGKTPITAIQPPYPTTSGLFGRPTLIHSAELLAHLPYLIQGTDMDTRLVKLCGDVDEAGFAEINIGCGVRNALSLAGISSGLKAIQVGGATGGFFDADTDAEFGGGLFTGDGSIRAVSPERCMAREVLDCLDAAYRSSCGKCVFCREGLYQLYLIWSDIVGGNAGDGDLETVSELASVIAQNAACAFGRSAGEMVLSALNIAQNEIEQHISRKRCSAMVCPGMFSVYILGEKCVGCGDCLKRCPREAVNGGSGLIHVIDQSKCTQCLNCFVCKHGAMTRIPAKTVPPITPDSPIPVGSFVTRKKGLQRRTK